MERLGKQNNSPGAELTLLTPPLEGSGDVVLRGPNHPRLLSKDEIDRLCARYTYDPATGAIYRRGKRVRGYRDYGGYSRIHIQSKEIKHLSYHRLCWILYYRENPRHVIDHINGDNTDNRICNLRDVTQGENNRNVHRRKSPTTGFVGITMVGGKTNNSPMYCCRKGDSGFYYSRYLCDCVNYRLSKGKKV